MNARRPWWSVLFFAHLALVVLASGLAASGHFPGALFRAPFDKVGHLGAYGLLSFLAVSFFGHRHRYVVVLTLLGASCLEEVSQRAFSTRTFDLGDLAMNAIGIVGLGTLAAWRLAHGRKEPRGAGEMRLRARSGCSRGPSC